MIYVDNAATTAVHMSVLQAMEPYFTQLYGNPSAQHAAGHAAHEGMHKARNTVASCLGCTDREIIFTASGSEADNQALRTAVAWGKAHGRNHVVTVAIEHPAILRTLDALQKEEDIEVSRVTPTHEGVITPEAVAELLRPTTCLVSVMTLNNEVGTLQPVHLISEKAHKAGALFHTDAVQAMGHVPYTMDDYGADMLSLSAHKFHGPKGIGALICRESAFNQKLEPVSLVYGGGQERGHRAATENIPGMVGLATALKEATDCIQEYLAHVYKLRTHLMEGLLEIPGSHLMGDPNARVGILNICFEDVNREALVTLLDREGICASAGSACAAGAVSISPVLRAMGVPQNIAAGALRISFNLDNTDNEMNTVISAVRDVVKHLRSVRTEE